jgi:hypothetical protein
MKDLDEAILSYRECVQLTSQGHPTRPGYLNNLGVSLELHFRQSGERTDLDEAILFMQESVQLALEGHSAQSNNGGNSMQLLFEQQKGRSDEAMLHFQESIQLASHGPSPYYCNVLGSFVQVPCERCGEKAYMD